jgi:hypothetical protein
VIKLLADRGETLYSRFAVLGARDISYAELREIAKVLGTSVAALDLRVEEIIAAKEHAAGPVRRKR